jgi:hypothetical protein
MSIRKFCKVTEVDKNATAKKVTRRATVRVTRRPVDKDTMGIKVTPVKAVRKAVKGRK